MNKKFMIIALMAALSTVGFAYELPHLDAGATDNSGKIGVTKGNENFNSLAGEINRIDAEIAKGDRINGVQNQQIGNLQSQNVTQDKNILDNKNQIAASLLA